MVEIQGQYTAEISTSFQQAQFSHCWLYSISSLRLNIYGFKRTALGKLKGAYAHSLFVRGKPQLCKRMTRTTPAKEWSEVRTTPVNQQYDTQIDHTRAVSSEEYDPSSRTHENASSDPNDGADEDDIHCRSIRRTSTEQNRDFSSHSNPLHKHDNIDPASIEAFEPPRLVGTPCAMERQRSGKETSISQNEQMMFPCKLHRILHDAEDEGFEHIISWVNRGRAFIIHDRAAFMEQVSPNYFDHSKYESFRRQLNIYSFHRVMSGYDRGEYSHPLFLRGRWDLCRQIPRVGNPAVVTPHSENGSLSSIIMSTPVANAKRPRVASSHGAIQFQVNPKIR